MTALNKLPAFIVAGFILLLGIVHLGLAAGLIGAYRQYGDVFRLTIGVSGYNIVLALIAICLGGLAIFSVRFEKGFLCRIGAITSGVLGILMIASLITAMACISYATSFIRDRLTNKMASYIFNSRSIEIMNAVQNDFRCCGVNLWLDWSRYPLSASRTYHQDLREDSSTLSRSLRDFSGPASVLVQSLQLRQRRQSNIYNLPGAFALTLPISCCSSGGVTSGNALGGVCLYNSTLGVSGINVDGCLTGVSNLATSQLSAYILLNTLMIILSFVLVPILLAFYNESVDPNNPNGKQEIPNQYEFEQQPPMYQTQMTNTYVENGYVTGYSDPSTAYGIAAPVYAVYQQF